jgi:glycosyltransferase involved in cell wall biosynthesis
LPAVLVLTYSKQAGGAEKSAIKLYQALRDSEDIQAVFGTLVRSPKDFYQIQGSSKSINLLPLTNFLIAKKIPFRFLWLPLVAPIDLIHFRLSMYLHRINVVVSFGAGVGCVSYLALIGSRIKQVTSERIDPNPRIYKPSLLARILRPFIYKHGVICSVQTVGFAKWVKENWAVSAVVTPNHFEIPEAKYRGSSLNGPVVAVGRPAFQKGYDLLLNAWRLVEESDSRELWIVCDDSQGFIADLIESTGCRNVRVHPLTDDLHGVFDKSSLFISTARFEGYPNAIAEAILYGIPVMTSVSSDIVENWSQAQLCIAIKDTEPEKLSKQILTLLNDRELLHQISINGISNRNLFDWKSVQDSWLSVLR